MLSLCDVLIFRYLSFLRTPHKGHTTCKGNKKLQLAYPLPATNFRHSYVPSLVSSLFYQGLRSRCVKSSRSDASAKSRKECKISPRRRAANLLLPCLSYNKQNGSLPTKLKSVWPKQRLRIANIPRRRRNLLQTRAPQVSTQCHKANKPATNSWQSNIIQTSTSYNLSS